MRPLTLRISNLRSYRSDQTIDFSDAGLMAIVGDTGAGKSSILEALFFVLYGGCTWDHRAAVPLISDGADVMQVELTFSAEGQRWRIFRSVSRSGAQSRHKLECVDDPAARFDTAAQVTAEVERLTGLDHNAFLRTVILPQGRFQMLLQATRAERTAILKGIFRLDELAAARDQADMIGKRLRPGLEDLRVKRAALLPDPKRSLEDAKERRRRAGALRARLQGLSDEVSAQKQQLQNAEQRSMDLKTCAQAVREALVPTAPAELARLSEMAAQIDSERQQLRGERDERESEARALAGQLKQADKAGAGLQALAAADTTIAALQEQLPGLQAEAAACEDEARELDGLSLRLKEEDKELGLLQHQADEAQRKADELADAVTSANSQVTDTRAQLAVARTEASRLSGLQTDAQDAAERVKAAREAVDLAAEKSGTAATERETARTAFEAIQRAHAAAHAAEGREPGDPCPICSRPLPAGFHVPHPPGESEARDNLTAAEHTADAAATELAARKADLTNAETSCATAERRAGEAQATFAAALDQLKVFLPDLVSLDTQDQVLIAPLTAAVAAAAAKNQAQAAEATKLGQRAASAAAGIRARKEGLERRTGQLHRRRLTLQQRQAACEKAAASLPHGYTVAAPLTAELLAATAKRLATRRQQLNEVNTRLNAVREDVDETGRRIEALDDRRRTEVDVPAQRLLPKVAASAQRLNDLAAKVELPAAPLRPDGELPDDAAWASQLQAKADTALTRAEQVLTEIRHKRDLALATVQAALAAADTHDETGLARALIDASAELRQADTDVRVAKEQIPRAAELDDKIKRGGGLLAALDELCRHLTDGRFIGYVVARKQQTLLSVASEVLSSMTGSRYGFSEQFDIIDRLTGLPRGVKTLSGGETFLASLSLALGLVELAGRGGGRLDALFLDEGFGSLDANSLAEALEALEHQAESGRLVVVISHLRSIAENMEKVLAVALGPGGSRAHWLAGDERDEVIAEEVESSLLS